MLIYDYDPVTKEYIGSRVARKSPLDDEWLIPAHATAIAPPALQSGYARCFINGAWVQVEDHRGLQVYDTSTKGPIVISELGPVPAGCTLTASGPYDRWINGAWATDIAAMKTDQKLQAINTIQTSLDAKAREYGFDNIHTAILNAQSSSEDRAKKGQAFRTWYDACWDFAEAEWKKQEAGSGSFATIEAFIAALPAFIPPL